MSRCGKFDVKYFWSAIADEKVKNLLFAHRIYLPDEGDDCVLIIGIVPHKRFSIGARIELKYSRKVLQLDKVTLLDLIECIDEQFSEDTVYPKFGRSVRIRSVDEKHFRIYICAGVGGIGDDVYEQSIKLHLDALLAMREKCSVVKTIVKMLECNKYEDQLHNLLAHFCYDADERLVVKAMQAPADIDKLRFNNVMCLIECQCIDKRFAVEVVNGCGDWFLACTAAYIRTLISSQN